MTFYPCPLCGKVPHVEAHHTGLGTLWTASCECFGAHAHDRVGLAYSWALYCLRMQGESP